MSDLSVTINSFEAGGLRLGGEDILPSDKKRLELVLSNYFLNQKKIAQLTHTDSSIPFQLKLEPGCPTLQLKDRKFDIQKGSGLRKIERVIQFYQHIGTLPKEKLDPKEEREIRSAAKVAIQAAKDASIPGTNDQILAGVRIADDSLSTIQNILFAVPSIGIDDPIANHLGYYVGTFWTFFSLRELKGGWHDYKRGKEIGDDEGCRRAEARIASGTIVSSASLTYLAGKICGTLGLEKASQYALGSANLLFGAGSALAMAASAISAARCYRFSKRLDRYLNQPKLDEVGRLKSALHFLEKSLIVIPEEKIAIQNEIERNHPDLSAKEKEALYRKKLINEAEKRVKYMKRRTSNKSVRMIFEKVAPILSKLENEATRPEGINEAKKLIQTVKCENRKKMILFLIGVLAAAICLAGTIAGTVFSASLLSLILYSIAGGLSMGVAIYSLGNVLASRDLSRLSSIQDPLEALSSIVKN